MAGRDVSDNRVIVVLAQPLAINLAEQRADGCGLFCMPHTGHGAGFDAESLERVFRQADLVLPDDIGIINDVQRGGDAVLAGDDLDLG